MVKLFVNNNMDPFICGYCVAFGIVENNVVTLPCINCAYDNEWMWNDKKCYGAYGLGEADTQHRRESTLEEVVYYYIKCFFFCFFLLSFLFIILYLSLLYTISFIIKNK